jgi:cholesterol oxidase
MAKFDYDVVIIGSGFGGSVAALRAAEKGYRVGVMEAGRRWKDQDIPKTQWNLPHFLWFPAAELYGLQRIEYLDDVLILSGAGVGGGSHVYANTLYVPPKKFFDEPGWAGITDWADELAPCIDQARRMLGVARYPYMPTDVDRALQQVAIEMGRAETFNKAPVGVYFGSPGVEAEDPYFGGVGPWRTGCISCGNCNIGCGHNAKNKLTTTICISRNTSAPTFTSCTKSTTSSRWMEAGSRCTRAIPVGHNERRSCTVIPTPPSR